MKQSRLLFRALSFILAFFGASLSATVEPITPGESLWKLVSRIGVTSDIIESKLCGASHSCDVLIHQDDIAPGGVGGGTYEITGTGGTYCLAGLTRYTVGPAIQISGSNITLDLQGFVLDGQPFGGPQASNAILLKADASNIVIKNGTISHCVNGITDEGIDIPHSNITIDGIRFVHGSGVAISLDLNATIPDMSSLLIENCIFDSTRSANIQCLDVVIRNCTINGAAAFHPEGFFISGAGIFPAQAVSLQDCIIDGTKSFVLEITNAHVGTVQRLTKSGALSVANFFDILFDSVDHVVMSDVVISPGHIASGALIRVDNPHLVVATRCFGQGLDGAFISIQSGPRDICGVQMSDCRAQPSPGLPAFDLIATGTSAFQNVVMIDCFAVGGSIAFSGDTGSSFLNCVFDHCISHEGFIVKPKSGAFPALEHIIFRDCISSGFSFNSTELIQDIIFQRCFAINDNDPSHFQPFLNGFELGPTSTLCKVIDCFALGYTGTGFVNNAPLNANYFFGNTGVANGTNYGGSGSLEPVLLNTGATEIAGGTPWTNASMP